MTSNYRSGTYMQARMADKIVLAILLVPLYWRKGYNDIPTNITNMIALYYTLSCMPVQNAAVYIPGLVRLPTSLSVHM